MLVILDTLSSAGYISLNSHSLLKVLLLEEAASSSDPSAQPILLPLASLITEEGKEAEFMKSLNQVRRGAV